jgi:hypothetical protein
MFGREETKFSKKSVKQENTPYKLWEQTKCFFYIPFSFISSGVCFHFLLSTEGIKDSTHCLSTYIIHILLHIM